MTTETFSTQVERLRGVWPNGFPKERVAIIFNAVKKMPDHWLESATTDFIGNSRQAPLLKDFLEKALAYEQLKKEENTFRGGSGNVVHILREAAAKTPNREFASRCVKLLQDKVLGRITREQFKEGCAILDEASMIFTKADGDYYCVKCGGSGYTHIEDPNKYTNIMRCYCDCGSRRPQVALGPPDSSGKRSETNLAQIKKFQD